MTPSPARGPEPGPQAWTAAEIRGDDTGYLAYHAPRYAYLLEALQRRLPTERKAERPTLPRLLDIGPSPFTELLRRSFGLPVDTLGFGEDRCGPKEGSPVGDHYFLDLNACAEPGLARRDLPTYRAVILAEVLEHLHVAPSQVFGFLRGLLEPGGLLVVQTPNAASLPKRLKLLFGKNPYDLIREDRGNPGHFREYTLPELRDYAAGVGFEIVESRRAYYFDARFAHHGPDGVGTGPPSLSRRLLGLAKNALYRVVPPGLREGLTLVLRRSY